MAVCRRCCCCLARPRKVLRPEEKRLLCCEEVAPWCVAEEVDGAVRESCLEVGFRTYV